VFASPGLSQAHVYVQKIMLFECGVFFQIFHAVSVASCLEIRMDNIQWKPDKTWNIASGEYNQMNKSCIE